MKVKKLLTLLLVAGAMSACQLNGATNNSGSSDNNPSTQSPSSDSSLPDNSSEDSSAASSDSSADQSSSDSSSSSSEAPTLASIAVTAPTKVDYLTSDTELDLAGMVVTATMSDGSTQAVASGYEVSQVDFSTAGQKDVTVTYQGKSDSFQINVSVPAPTNWSDEDLALMAQYLSGYTVPFFSDAEMGSGEMEWVNEGETYLVCGYGDETDVSLADGPAAKVAALFVESGMTLVSAPDFENNKNYYSLQLIYADANSANHMFAVKVGALADNNYTKEGEFYIEFTEPYYYSWAETGLEAILQAYFKTEEDIPDLPAGALFSKSNMNYTAQYIQYKQSTVPVWVTCSAEYALAVPALFEQAGWFAFETANGYSAISPLGTLRVDGSYSATDGELRLAFSVPAELPEKVTIVAGLFNMNGYTFTKSSTIYYYEGEAELEDGETTLRDIFDRYEAMLVAGGLFVQKGGINAKDDDISANYFYEDKLIRVDLEVASDVDEEGNPVYGVAIVIRDFIAIPQEVKDVAEVLELNAYAFNKNPGNSNVWWIQEALSTELTTEEIYNTVAAYATALLAATQLEYELLGEIDSDGDGGFYVDLANQSKKVEIWVYRTLNSDKTVKSITLQVSIDDYELPESALKDALAAKLGITFKWSNADQDFWYNGTVVFEEGLTYQSVVEGFEDALLECSDDVEELTHEAGSSYYTSTWYCPEGCFEFQCWLKSAGEDGAAGTADDVIMTLVRFSLYDQSIPLQVNVIGTQLGARVTVEDGVYSCLVDTFYYGGYYYTAGYTAAQIASIGNIIISAVAADLVGFALQGEITIDEETGVISGTYLNSTTGVTVTLSMPYDEEGETIGVLAVIVPPAPQA